MKHFDYNQVTSFSYEQLFQTMRELKLQYPDAEQLFRRMVFNVVARNCDCLLYTSDADDERSSVDLGGRRIIKKKTKN